MENRCETTVKFAEGSSTISFERLIRYADPIIHKK